METLSKNKIKWIRSFRLKKNRDLESVFVVEGEKMVNEMIQKWPEKIVLLCSQTAVLNFSGESYLVDEKSMKEISSLTTPTNVLAVVQMPVFEAPEENFILALDGIQDPGNMGTILRTADWFKVDQIVCSINSVDVFNSKVIQSSMGSLFNVPVSYVNLKEYLSTTSLEIYGALLSGSNIYEQSLIRQGIVVIGNEGSGISEEIKSLINHSIHIPRFGQAESLNASVATGIILSEFCRKG